MAGNPDEWPTVITAEAIRSQVGKTVPLRLGIGGPVIGQATLRENGRIECVIEVDHLPGIALSP